MDKLRLRARELRSGATDAERRLWDRLRQRQLKGFRFRRQHPIDHYIVDFACIEAKLIVELDGSHHLDQAEADRRRTHDLEQLGYRVIRFWNDDVLLRTDDVANTIFDALPG
jgi:very-short-patch-repair endonuclease